MAVALALGHDLPQDVAAEAAGELRNALAANLALNAGWSALFFKGHQPGPATLEAGVLAISSADLARRNIAVNKRRGAFLLPYAAWTAFATVLTGTIWHQNR